MPRPFNYNSKGMLAEPYYLKAVGVGFDSPFLRLARLQELSTVRVLRRAFSGVSCVVSSTEMQLFVKMEAFAVL